jgi:hypothetical protein
MKTLDDAEWKRSNPIAPLAQSVKLVGDPSATIAGDGLTYASSAASVSHR